MQAIWIEGEDGIPRPFHARYIDEWYDFPENISNEMTEEEEIEFMETVLDEDGEPIPKTVCLCSAYSSSECCCGAWDGTYDWYFTDEYTEYELSRKKLERLGYDIDELEMDNPYNRWTNE